MVNPRLKSYKRVIPACLYHNRCKIPAAWDHAIGDGNYSALISGRTGCLHQNTKIITSRGISKLKDLPHHFMVQSYNLTTGKKEFKPAIKINSGKKKLYRIKLSNGSEVIASADHIFFRIREEEESYREVPLKDLKTGDCLLSK